MKKAVTIRFENGIMEKITQKVESHGTSVNAFLSHRIEEIIHLYRCQCPRCNAVFYVKKLLCCPSCGYTIEQALSENNLFRVD